MSSRESLGAGALGALGPLSDDGFNGGGDLPLGMNFSPLKGLGTREDELKQLLLVNLDLIQNQQELLLTNERTILALKRENEMLKCRLDRIERRMSLVYHKGLQSSTPAPSGSSPHQHSAVRPTRSSGRRKLNLEATDVGSESAEKAEDFLKKPEPETDDKRILETSLETVDHKTQVPLATTRKSAGKMAPCRSKAARRGGEPNMASSDVEASSKHQKAEDGFVSERAEVKQDRLRRRIRKNSDLLMTDALYFVPSLPPVVDDDDDEDDENLVGQEQILVPSWRIKHLSTLYVMEGTENLDDRLFLKRHQKFEAEEKRRKRWDIRRLKDLQVLRKQQLKEESSSVQKQEIVTFLPQIDKVLYIEVGDKVPVSAFGYSLPTVQTAEFHLPWYTATKDNASKNKRLRRT